MRKKQIVPNLLIAVVFAIVSICVFSTKAWAEHGDYGGYTVETLGSLRMSNPNKLNRNVLREAKGVARRISIANYSLEYYNKPSDENRSADSEIDIRPRFKIKEVNGFAPEDFTVFTVFVDTNGNGEIDEDEKDTVGGSASLKIVEVDKETGELVEALVVFNEMHNLKYQKEKHFVLVADLVGLEEGDSFAISKNLYYDGDKIDYVMPSDNKDLYTYGSFSIEHYVGNRQPKLGSYGAGLVSSSHNNMEGSPFTFRVEYEDPDGDEPSEISLHLDMGDGYKKYPMESLRTSGEASWTSGEYYSIKVNLKFNLEGVKYKFSASDGELFAEGVPTEEQVVVVFPWALVDKVSMENKQVLPGQKVPVEVIFIVHFDTEVNWSYSEGKKYADYTVSNIVLGKKEPMPGIADFMFQPVSLDIIPAVGFGKRSIGAIEFPYSVNKERKDETESFSYKNVLQMPDVELEVVPAIAKMIISQEEVILGDKVKYTLVLKVHKDATMEQMTTIPTEPFRKIGDTETNVTKFDKITLHSYVVDTWSYKLPFERDEKTGDMFYRFPEFNRKASYGKEKYDIIIPSKKVRFIAPLSISELKSPQLPVEVIWAIDTDKRKLLFRSKVPIIAGAVLLGSVVIFFLISFLVSSKKTKGTSTKEKRDNLEECIEGLVINLRNLEHVKDEKLREHATICLVGICEFLNFFSGSGVNMRTKDRGYINEFVKNNSVLFGGNTQAFHSFRNLLIELQCIIYDDDIDIDECKRNESLVSKYLDQEKNRITKMIK